MEETWPEWLIIVALVLLVTVTVSGNALVIASVASTKRLRTVTNCFVTSLAIADLMVAVFVMPPAIAYHIFGSWKLGQLLCDLWVSLDVLLCTASILSLSAISLDRYLAVTQPLLYSRRRRSKKLALTMILIVWVAAAAITCPPILGWYDPKRNVQEKCTYNQNAGYVVFSAMGSFFVPLLGMLYIYTRIAYVIANRHENIDLQEESENGVGIAVYSAALANKSRVASLRRESKTAQTLALVVGGFVACWLPFFVLYIITPFLKHAPPENLSVAFTWLGWVNSAINPFIYASYSQDFRTAFWRLTLYHCCPRSIQLPGEQIQQSRGDSRHSSRHQINAMTH